MVTVHVRRAAVAALVGVAVALAFTAPAAAQQGTSPALGATAGEAHGQALAVAVGLPGELAEPLAPLFDALGVAGDTTAIRLDLAATTAQLRRAAEGEEVDGLAEALVTDLLLDSGVAGSPGGCTGGETVELPDAENPAFVVTVAGIDCRHDDERALADAEVVGARVGLGHLVDLAGADALRDGLDQLFAPVRAELVPLLEEVCDQVGGPLRDGLAALPILGLDGAELCDAIVLRLDEVFDVDVDLLDVRTLRSTSEVVHDDGAITATATSGLADLSIGGLVCLRGADGAPLETTVTARSDGQVGTATTATTTPTVDLCDGDPLLQVVDATGLLAAIEIAGTPADELLGDELAAVRDGVEQGLGTLLVDTERSLTTYADTTEDGAAATATAGFRVVELAPFRGVAPLATTPLGAISVEVVAGHTEVAVDAAPAAPPAPAPEPEPTAAPPTEPELPRTGPSGVTWLGLAAIGAAAALRRPRTSGPRAGRTV